MFYLVLKGIKLKTVSSRFRLLVGGKIRRGKVGNDPTTMPKFVFTSREQIRLKENGFYATAVHVHC
jgi:hypothetical protein